MYNSFNYGARGGLRHEWMAPQQRAVSHSRDRKTRRDICDFFFDWIARKIHNGLESYIHVYVCAHIYKTTTTLSSS